MPTSEKPVLPSLLTRVQAKPSVKAHVDNAPTAPAPDSLVETLQPFAGVEGFDLYGHFLNPMVSAAKGLIGLTIRLRTLDAVEDLGRLHRDISTSLGNLVSNAEQLGYDPTNVQMMSYTLCLLLDEAVMRRPWGEASFWSQESLLSQFHQETHGGEKFFVLLDRLMDNPDPYHDVLELIFVCLCIGLRGQYAIAPKGEDARNALIKQLHALIKGWWPPMPEHDPLKNVVQRPMRIQRQWPWWGTLLVCAGVLVGMFSYFRYRLSAQTDQLLEALKVFY